MGIFALVAYVATIFGANWALATFGVMPIGFHIMAPAGVFFAGLALCLRDVVQDELGKRWTIAAILIGAAVSYLVSPQFALASGIAFLFSETSDFLVYTPLRERGYWMAGIVASNTAGDLVDSCLFLWLAFGSLSFLEGQLIGKWLVTIPFVAAIWMWRRRDLSEWRGASVPAGD